MFEGLFQPMHILIFLFLFVLVPVVLVIRLLWRLGSKRSPQPKGQPMILPVTLFLLCCSIGATAVPRKATLAQQKICSEQADKIFHREYAHADSGDLYLSHYDRTRITNARLRLISDELPDPAEGFE